MSTTLCSTPLSAPTNDSEKDPGAAWVTALFAENDGQNDLIVVVDKVDSSPFGGPSKRTRGTRWYVCGSLHLLNGTKIGSFARQVEVTTENVRMHHAGSCIDEAYQGRGIGTGWVKRCFDRYRANGITEVGLSSGATIVWTRCGFDWANPEDARSMMQDAWKSETQLGSEMSTQTRTNIDNLMEQATFPSAATWQKLADAEEDDAWVYRLLLDHMCGIAMRAML